MSYYRNPGDLSYKLLTQPEEKALFDRYRAGGPDGDAARFYLIENFLPAALSLVRSTVGQSSHSEDLVAVANAGLMRALESYDPTRTACFLTYATLFIRGRIYQQLRDSHKQKRLREKLFQQGEDSPSAGYRRQSSSDSYLGEIYRSASGESSGWQMLSHHTSETDYNFDLKHRIREILEKDASTITAQQRLVLVGVYVDGKTYADLARDMRISRERIRQVHNRAICKLRIHFSRE